MNVEYINPFVQGAQSTISKISGEKPALGAIKVKLSPYSCAPVAITIEFIGNINAYGIFNMNEALACHIASKMMGGMSVPALDDMSKSAIAELGNMISGNVATLIASRGVKIDIKPPIINVGVQSSSFSFIRNDEKLVSIPLQFGNGEVFTIDVLLRE